MSSRQEEKERRRQERLEAERREAAGAARKRRLGIVTATVLGLAAVAAVAIAVASGGGDSKNGTGAPKGGQSIANVAIPEQQTKDLTAAAQAAGCTVTNPAVEGRDHTTSRVTYKSNPPTSGNHNPTPASDGNYVGVETPAPEYLVHALEHGRIEIQYKPGLPTRQIGQLQSLFDERPEYVLLFENGTGMKPAVAAAAWTHLLSCPKMNAKVFDALRAFRDQYTLKAPEVVTEKE